MRDKRAVINEYTENSSDAYRIYGADSVLICNVACLDKTVDSFFVYSPASGEFAAAKSFRFEEPLVSLKAKVSAASSEIVENVISGLCNSFVIRTDDIDNGVLLAYLLFRGNNLDYLVSASGAKGLAGSYYEKIVSDTRRGRILIDYLSEFEKKGSIIITADKFDSSLNALCSCSDIGSIVVVSSLSDVEPSVPVLDVRNIEGRILPHDNDSFKKMFLETIRQHNIADQRIYAYILNNIDSTDKLTTVMEIAKHIRRIETADEDYGTSILHNAIYSSGRASCGVIAHGGGAYRNGLNDCVDIVRFLVSRGLRYKSHSPNEDIGGMPSELYDSYNLGIMFRTLMEAGYYISNQTIFEFVGSFIMFAQSNDSLTPIDDSHGSSYWKRLDKVRCEQFDTMSPYIPDEVFSMRYKDGETLLILVAKHFDNLPKLFKKILARTKDIDALDEEGCSALHYIGDLERWDALVAAGADTDIKDREGKIPKLNFDRIELSKLLSKSEYSETDLVYAERMLFALIDDSYTSMATYENEDMILSLLDVVRPEAKSWKGGTFLMEMIVQEGYFPEIYDKMLAIGVDINAVDNSGNNTLRVAVLSPECTLAKIRYLIEHGADESPNRYRGTVATIAAGLFHIESQEWNALWELSDKSIFTYHNDDVMSPIMVALHYLNMEAIRFLFCHDAVPVDEIEKIKDKIGRIKSKTTKVEVLEYFHDYRKRIS